MKITARLLVALTFVSLLSVTLINRPPVAKAAPLDLSGEIDGAPYRIRVPEVWNGTLLIFAHGYRDKADHPGEIDNRNADIAPSAALEAPLLAHTTGREEPWSCHYATAAARILSGLGSD
jgi:hypothetical protein